MNKNIKLLSRLNVLSYTVMLFMYALVKSNSLDNLNNLTKFFIGSSPLLFMIITSFILASDANKEFKAIKYAARLDWGVRLAAFVIILFEISYGFNNMYLSLGIILFIINCILENIMNRKLQEYEK